MIDPDFDPLQTLAIIAQRQVQLEEYMIELAQQHEQVALYLKQLTEQIDEIKQSPKNNS